jgi:hypothetical protein
MFLLRGAACSKMAERPRSDIDLLEALLEVKKLAFVQRSYS